MMVADNSTEAVAKLVMNPARMPPVINGTTMRITVRDFVAPRFSAASSNITLTCCKAAMQARSAYGKRRIANAITMITHHDANGLSTIGTLNSTKVRK